MINLSEADLAMVVQPFLRSPTLRSALATIVNDRLSLSLFLTGVSYVEGIGELAVSAIRQSEVARLMHDLRRHELEEHGHMVGIRLIVQELFPEHFVDGKYRFESFVSEKVGREWYLMIRDTVRRRLRQRDCYSPLSMYLVITFGGETMVEQLYETVIEVLDGSTLPADVRERVSYVLRMILVQEETHDVLLSDQHNALLRCDRGTLSAEASGMIDALERMTADDYKWTTEFLTRTFVSWIAAFFTDPSRVQAALASGAGHPA